MKKLLLSFALVAISASLFAQLLTPPSIQKGIGLIESKKITENQNTKAPFDTIGWTPGSLPCYGDPTIEFNLLTLTDSLGTPSGHWFGVNYDKLDSTSMDYWAMAYICYTPVMVTGFIIGIAEKDILVGGASSYIGLSLYYLAADQAICAAGGVKCPGPNFHNGSPIATGQLAANDIDTTWVGNLGFNYVGLPSPVYVSGDFAIVANFKPMRLATDSAHMYCDAPGNHGGMNYSYLCLDPTQYYWVTLKLATTDAYDVNMPLFAVVDQGSVGINDNFFQGMKLTTSPNPASDMLVMEYALQNNSNVKVQFISSKGGVVKEVELGVQNASNYYKETIDISDLAAGNYFVSLMSNGNRLTKQIVVE